MERNLGVDLLKVISCFAVVVLHVSGIIANDINNSYTINHLLYYSAVLAVPMFFMVNGYFLLNKNILEYRYVFKKIANILMVILCWNLLLFILKLISNKEIVNPIVELVKNLIQRGYFWQFWFFGALILIYIILPIIYKYFKDSRVAIIITVIFIGISLIVDMLSLYRNFNGQSIIQINVPQTFRIWTWFSYYFLGGVLGKKQIMEFLLNKISKNLNIAIVIISFLVINFYEYFIGKNLYNNTFAEYFYDNIFIFLYVISVFLFIYRININNSTLIDLCSNNIMGIYIIHISLIKLFKHYYKFDTQIYNICLILIVFIS